MILASVFAIVLCLLLILVDWYRFTSLHPLSACYGVGLAERRDHLDRLTHHDLLQRLGSRGTMSLPHGVARWCETQQVIVLRPSYQLSSVRFRTAWPLKGTIELHPAEAGVTLYLTKRMPWSSGVFTILWLALVLLGTFILPILFWLDGGFQSVGGWLVAAGVSSLGVVFLLCGVVVVALSYDLEDTRLMQVYRELRNGL